MSSRELLVLLVAFLANIVEAITGFAGTMLAMPAAMLLVGVKEAKVMLNVVALFVSTTIAVKNRHSIHRREVIKITSLMLVGMAVGLYLFETLPVTGLMRIYGATIILIALKGLLMKKGEKALPQWVLVGVVLVAGVIHGMFLSGGALLVIYAVSVLKDKDVIRATLAPVWIILNLIILTQDAMVGNVTVQTLKLTVLCLPLVALAIVIGNQLHKKIKQGYFIRLTYLLLVVSGVTLFA